MSIDWQSPLFKICCTILSSKQPTTFNNSGCPHPLTLVEYVTVPRNSHANLQQPKKYLVKKQKPVPK